MWSCSRVERVQSPVSAESSSELQSLASLEEAHLAVPLAEMVARARSASGEAGEVAIQAVNQALRTLLPTEANGEALLRMLDEGTLTDLRAADGTSARILGVEALLRLGYPWAVRIHPEELQWYRETLAAQRRRRILVVLSALAVAAGSALYLLRFFGA